ncbi:ACT domain-containing protein [Diplocloster agilis]|uniref:ACT domain-containing protein n=1 Tax=Diplocloster agilis TaxID=2850323 RepID=A0A949K550_9FIRM|nr:ACT domain-containing protein [Diplocloster agilis]MBU9739210.1 ACT domain-containing protein [Diplocloster agilis]
MSNKTLEIKVIDYDFSICQVRDYSLVHFESNYCFTGKTDEEFSLVCVTEDVPANFIRRDDGWKAFRIQGVLDFSLIGILSRISALLAENKIGIFALSTFNTDYILTKAGDFTRAVKILSDAGYAVV